MIINIKNAINGLLKEAGTNPVALFAEVINEISDIGLISNTAMMYEINEALFADKKMLGNKLYQHSIYEAMGGELIENYADKYTTGKLKEDMKLQAKDEFKHGKMLGSLIRYTGQNIKDITNSNEKNVADDELPNFNNDIKTFICFVHAAEIRTMVMIDQYLHIIKKINDPIMNNMILILEHIKTDEKQHAAYTGNYINEWLKEDADLKKTLVNCFLYTNKESWQEISNMSGYVAKNYC